MDLIKTSHFRRQEISRILDIIIITIIIIVSAGVIVAGAGHGVDGLLGALRG